MSVQALATLRRRFGIAIMGGLLMGFSMTHNWISGGVAATFPTRPAQPAPVLPECTCRYQGQNVPLGTHICLMTSEGPRFAECVREVNVTSWRPGTESCTLARLNRPVIYRSVGPGDGLLSRSVRDRT
jgi:hypothetical protein